MLTINNVLLNLSLCLHYPTGPSAPADSMKPLRGEKGLPGLPCKPGRAGPPGIQGRKGKIKTLFLTDNFQVVSAFFV